MTDAASISALRSWRILVVEDDYLVAQALTDDLKGAGVEVLGPVPDIQGALDLLDAGPAPDRAILDINLGGEMVYPLADILQDRNIPFVFATGYEAWSIPERYKGLPRREKPLSVQQIAEVLAV